MQKYLQSIKVNHSYGLKIDPHREENDVKEVHMKFLHLSSLSGDFVVFSVLWDINQTD